MVGWAVCGEAKITSDTARRDQWWLIVDGRAPILYELARTLGRLTETALQ